MTSSVPSMHRSSVWGDFIHETWTLSVQLGSCSGLLVNLGPLSAWGLERPQRSVSSGGDIAASPAS